jgi:hypothetical protein
MAVTPEQRQEMIRMVTPYTGTHCIHSILPNGAHRFEFRQSTQQAVEEWLAMLEAVALDLPQESTFRYILDYRLDEPPPIAYAALRIRHWISAHSDHCAARVAFVYASTPLVTLLTGVVRMLRPPRTTVRFFRDDRYGEAVAWLLSDEP